MDIMHPLTHLKAQSLNMLALNPAYASFYNSLLVVSDSNLFVFSCQDGDTSLLEENYEQEGLGVETTRESLACAMRMDVA